MSRTTIIKTHYEHWEYVGNPRDAEWLERVRSGCIPHLERVGGLYILRTPDGKILTYLRDLADGETPEEGYILARRLDTNKRYVPVNGTTLSETI